MKKSYLSLLTMVAFIFGMTACSGSNKSEEAKNEDVIAGSIPKSLLTEELKMETVQLLKDLPDSEIPFRLYADDVTISVSDLSFLLPVSKAADLNTMSQKARACGMYFSDYNLLKALGQPTTEIENTLIKLTTDLNISFVQNIMKEQAPANASKEEFRVFLKEQQHKLIDEMAANDKIDIQLEMIGGMSAEYACVLANPSLVVKGDATSAGLSENMEKRVEMLGEIVEDLSAYYPHLQELKTVLSPLQEKVESIQTARSSQAEILAIRDQLLK